MVSRAPEARNRVLLVHRYYWPDVPPYAHMLRFIGARLTADGHDVTVFTGPVTYNRAGAAPAVRDVQDGDAGIRVRRVHLPDDTKRVPALRALSLLVFAFRLVAYAVRHRSEYDLMTVSTIPPVVMGLAARIIRRLTGLPYIYHCMDLYPEVLEVTGISRSRALLRLARRIDTRNCQAAAVVVVLSHDMMATLRRRGLNESNIIVLNNFSIMDGAGRADDDLQRTAGFRITFAGNLGRFQGLDIVLDAARVVLATRSDVEFVFMGSGVYADELHERAADLWPAVRIVGQKPVEVAAGVLEASDLGLISLSPGMYRVAYPSKTAACLHAGCRVLAVVEPESELAGLVAEAELGSVSPPGDVGALVRALCAEIDRGPATEAERDRLREVCTDRFGRAAKLDAWSELVRRVGRKSHG
jgi:glycosyltransferase involved in cell wall biosynthesis